MTRRLMLLGLLSGCVEYNLEREQDSEQPGTPSQPDTPDTPACDGNLPPEILSWSPAADAVLDESSALALDAQLSDDQPADTLWVRWFDQEGQLIDQQQPAADGWVSGQWHPGRTAGEQKLSILVEDSCGEQSTADRSVCQQGGYAVETLELSTWQLEGSATLLSDHEVSLTSTEQWQTGTAFFITEAVSADAVHISFDVMMGGGTGADGLSLTALRLEGGVPPAGYMGGSGCGLGYGGGVDCTEGPALPGWSVELDTWFNAELPDPTAYDHVAFTVDGDVASPEAWAVIPELEDTGWHTVEVIVDGGSVSVAIDGLAYLQAEIDQDLAFPAQLGFTASTGGQTNAHHIRSLTVTEAVCPTDEVIEPLEEGSVDPDSLQEVDVFIDVVSEWDAGYCADVTVTNPKEVTILWDAILPADGSITSLWSAIQHDVGAEWVFRGTDWNAELAPGASTTFGFCAQR